MSNLSGDCPVTVRLSVRKLSGMHVRWCPNCPVSVRKSVRTVRPGLCLFRESRPSRIARSNNNTAPIQTTTTIRERCASQCQPLENLRPSRKLDLGTLETFGQPRVAFTKVPSQAHYETQNVPAHRRTPTRNQQKDRTTAAKDRTNN